MYSMVNYYLDIETTGLDPKDSKIITIQYQRLERGTGRPTGPLVILKEWESTESDILDRFINATEITDVYPFSFIPTGTNLKFEHKFLHHKSTTYGKSPIDISNRPCIDVHDMLVLMNNGEFKNSGLDRMTGKQTSGKNIINWYAEKKYDRIIEYIEDETKEFSKFYVWLCKEMPLLHQQFMKSMQNSTASK